MTINSFRTKVSPFFLLVILLISQSAATAQQTLVDKNGQIMRGVRMIIGKWYYETDPIQPDKSTNKAMDVQHWQAAKDLGFNTVRLAWVDPWFMHDDSRPDDHWNVSEAVPYFDIAVANATATGMNIIINYHNVAEYQYTEGFGMMANFWQQIASRYKDNDLVYFELNNEQAWDASTYKSTVFKDSMKVVYDQVRADAPDRTIILFSFHSLALNMLSIAQDYTWVDWDHTAVGYHMYGWGNPPDSAQQLLNEQANFEALVGNTQFRTICTEWFYKGPSGNASYIRNHYGRVLSAEVLEMFNQSWMDWRNWDEFSFDSETEILIPDAQSKGYWWVVDQVEQAPYPNGIPHVIPGRIEVETFDQGGAGIAYNDADTANQGGSYRSEEVDIYGTADAGGGYAIGWISPGEWLTYTVEVAEEGYYDLIFRMASAQEGGSIAVEIDSVEVISNVVASNTGDWDVYTDVSAGSVFLEAGQHVLRVSVTDGGFNMNFMEFSTSVSTAVQPAKKIERESVKVIPSSSNIQCDIPDGVETNLRIFDALGRVVYAKSSIMESTTIPIDTWTTGVYFVHYASAIDEGVTRIVVR